MSIVEGVHQNGSTQNHDAQAYECIIRVYEGPEIWRYHCYSVYVFPFLGYVCINMYGRFSRKIASQEG